MENEHLKIVKSDSKEGLQTEKPLDPKELLTKLSTLGSVHERELAVIENLRRKGF